MLCKTPREKPMLGWFQELLGASNVDDLRRDLADWTPTEAAQPSMSGTEAVVMQALVARGEQYGLELVTKSEGRLRRGTIYVTLNRMVEKGFVAVREVPPEGPGRAPRRLYGPTGLGERVFEAKFLGARLLRRAMEAAG